MSKPTQLTLSVMEWLAFLKCYFGIMIPYYAVIILYDLFIDAKKVRTMDETEVSYDVKDLLSNGEQLGYVELEKNDGLSYTHENIKEKTGLENATFAANQNPSATEEKEVLPQGITFSQPPQGQGIPLADFIEKAKALSRKIEF